MLKLQVNSAKSMPSQIKAFHDRLKDLRAAMAEEGLAGFIVPRADEYQGEYSAAYAARLPWLTGFSGSAGVAIVLKKRAVILTDGRYTLQIRHEVDKDLYETGDITKMPVAEWLRENAGRADVIGYDPWLHTPSQLEKIRDIFDGEIKAVENNFVDGIWEDRPLPPQAPVEIFPEEIAGVASAKKRADVAEILTKQKSYAFILTLPDSIAWLLNIRGHDLEYAPVALSYAVIDNGGAVTWFISPEKVPDDVRTHLGDGVVVVDPADIESHIDALAEAAKKQKLAVAMDFDSVPEWFHEKIEQGGAKIANRKDPCVLPKAMKTPQECAAIREAHVHDGLAMARFLAWVDAGAARGGIGEFEVGRKLTEMRAQAPSFRSESFPPIVGFGPNGAIIHYRASAESSLKIAPPGLLLVDGGGQYEGGTTDITRTIAIGKPSADMCESFTRVLKGHIAVARARFPEGTTGAQIDALARQPLWDAGMDYAHGTGHGVGCYLCVHERGVNISMRGQEPLRAGMLISNEPGYYKEGAYGIRIENLILVRSDGPSAHTGINMLSFETVSLAPIDLRLVVKTLLNAEELAWLNAYHERVRKILAPQLEKQEKSWLEENTRPL
jgi:Xaa-Pro aminopeptidase